MTYSSLNSIELCGGVALDYRNDGRRGTQNWVSADTIREALTNKSPMIGRSSGTLPTRIQILMIAPFHRIFSGSTDVIH
jgi:hypothetical protein